MAYSSTAVVLSDYIEVRFLLSHPEYQERNSYDGGKQ